MVSKRTATNGGTTVEVISHDIRERIMSGALVAGQRVTQREIQETFRVSPSSAREAFRALAGEGLLEHQPHRGAVIRKMTRAEVTEIYRLREVVEGLAARLAAERAGAGCDVSLVTDLYRSGAKACAAGDFRAYSRNNRDFHDAIYELSGSPRTSLMARNLIIPLHAMHFQTLLERRALVHSLNGHRAIAEAIASGDAQAAEDEMRTHVHSSGVLVLRALPPLKTGET